MPRPVVVSVASLPAGGSMERNLGLALAAIDLAAAEGADIVCLPELFHERGVPHGDVREVALNLDGAFVSALGARSRDRGLYVVAPVHVLDGDRVFNSALLIDRRGALAGRYDKIHPTHGELAAGTTPGGGPAPVWTTDFGRIAALVCFDINWPEEWAAVKAAGAELVLWPSAYPGGFPLHAYAQRHGYFIATATWTDSVVIGLMGEALASTSAQSRQATARINLAQRLFHQDENTGRLPALRAKYGRRVSIRWGFPEGYFTFESVDDSLDEDAVAREFGLEPMDAYLARASRDQDEARGPSRAPFAPDGPGAG